MPCLMERQNTAAVTSSLTNPTTAGAAATAGAASYFDIACANPALTAATTGHLTSVAAFNPAPQVIEALAINNNASLLSQKVDLHRSAAGTWFWLSLSCIISVCVAL